MNKLSTGNFKLTYYPLLARVAELKHEVATWKSLQEGSAAIIDGLHKTLAQARRDENEACAQIAEKLEVQDDFGFWSRPTPAEIAAAIRARIAEPRDSNRTA